jgi:hypothetical protein
MEAIDKQIKFSARHEELAKATEKALAKIKPFLIEEAREKGTPIVVADKDGKPLLVSPDQFDEGDF